MENSANGSLGKLLKPHPVSNRTTNMSIGKWPREVSRLACFGMNIVRTADPIKKIPLMYSQFCHHYQQFTQRTNATMRIHRKPGEQLEVDWAGQTASIINRDTGEIIPMYVFVGVLSYSQYAYVEAFPTQNQESWITAHVHMYQFFGGCST